VILLGSPTAVDCRISPDLAVFVDSNACTVNSNSLIVDLPTITCSKGIESELKISGIITNPKIEG